MIESKAKKKEAKRTKQADVRAIEASGHRLETKKNLSLFLLMARVFDGR